MKMDYLIPSCKIAPKSGFTLLELLIVLSILGVVTTIGTQAFVTVTAAWNEKKTLIELDAVAQQAFDIIGRDFADILSQEVAGAKIQSRSGTYQDDEEFHPFMNPDDSISVPVQGIAPGRSLQRAVRVGYSIDRSIVTHPLVRTLGKLDDAFPTTGRLEIITTARTLGLRIEYLASEGKQLWLPEWQEDSLPSAIRISLTLEDLDRPEFQVARKTVIPIRVK